MLNIVTKTAERICLALTVTLFLLMIAAVSLQIVARYALPSTPLWTEELARFLLIYLVAAGCGLAVRRRELVNVDLVINLLPSGVRNLLVLVVDAITVVFSALFFVYALDYVDNSASQTATTLPVPMSWITAAVLVIAANLVFFTVMNLLEKLTGPKEARS